MDLEDGDCKDPFNTCLTSILCTNWLDCVDTCAHGTNTHSCYLACDDQFSASNSANQNLRSCACPPCGDVCKSWCTCPPH
jgi:hypothetical protein